MAASPDPVPQGEQVQYELRVTNHGAVDLAGVALRILLPRHIITFPPPAGANCGISTCEAGETMTWDLDVLPAGQSTTVFYTIELQSRSNPSPPPENAPLSSSAVVTANGVNESTAAVDVLVDSNPALTPTITHVDPDPVIGSFCPRPFAIVGSRFVPGSSVTLRDYSTAEAFPNRPISSQSETHITINPTFTTVGGTWSVEVIDPNGIPSGEFLFDVVAPTPVSTTAVPTAASFRMPIGDEAGDDLSPLSIGTFPTFDYPKIRFNDDGDAVPDDNEWYVATAFNWNRFLDLGWFDGLTNGPESFYNDFSGDGNADYHPGEDWNLNTGGDTDEGKSVYAIADGAVLFNGCAYGHSLIIAHRTTADEFITSFYGHLKTETGLAVGAEVSKGDPIGTIGKTVGTSCEVDPDMPAHLHFEIRRGPMVSLDKAASLLTLRHPECMWPASDFDGGDNGFSFIQENYYPPSEFLRDTFTGVAIESIEDDIPGAFALGQNYPNPFNTATTFRFDLPEPSRVSLVIYDMLGRRVAMLVSGPFPAGSFKFRWDATGLSSGVYVFRLQSGNYSDIKRLIILK